ncbi:DUF6414 family protein [Mycobacteroides abscessus]|uniref:DUF6414 family protein n=1 Tax=Mycobacteroides abscessus TaxID=36809 RepID=UPI000695E119|nr:hypothetical protein [Mycobacteroides abscessus]MDO3067114.1 hypothetical protein [Mycobacteroides abscessus subsp. bolletii]
MATMRGGAMLRKFVYLDTASLAEYTATLEGGLIAETRSRSRDSGNKSGAIKLKIAEGHLGTAKENEHEWTVSDEPEARFERLLAAAYENPETIGWREVMQPDSDFSEAQIGEFVSWECDAYEPDLSRLVSKEGATAKKIALMGSLVEALRSGVPLGEGSPLDLTALPQQEAQLKIMKELIEKVDIKKSVIGEDEATDWTVFGTLQGEYLRSDIDDERLVIVGKIKRKLERGHWRRIAEMINFETINRAERRQRAKQAPPEGKEHEYIAGPALELDILAIYR